MDELISLFDTDGDHGDDYSTKQSSLTGDNVHHFRRDDEAKPGEDAIEDFASFFSGNAVENSAATPPVLKKTSGAEDGALAKRSESLSSNQRKSDSAKKSKTNSHNTAKHCHGSNQTQYSKTETKSQTRKNKINSSTCDPITGLRITDRRTSRGEMVDAFLPFEYKSCSILAAASRADWNTFLTDGSNKNNTGNGGHSGKTNIATCGILTTDTGSRLSSKTGRAFAVLNLADLPSSMTCRHSTIGCVNGGGVVHASVSVFLFGDALQSLRNNKNFMRVGWAVAVLGPNVMPPRSSGEGASGGGTSVSLSVNDPRQILIVGKAVDCDRCKGMTRKRMGSGYGESRWEEVRCNTLIDLRFCQGVGGFCPTHKRQGATGSSEGRKNSVINNGKSSNGSTFMQKQRMERISMRQLSGNTINANNLKQTFGQGNGKGGLSFSEALAQAGVVGSSHVSASENSDNHKFLTIATQHGDAMTCNQSAPSHNQPYNLTSVGVGAPTLKRAPLHMKKGSQFTAPSTTNNGNSTRVNPYKVNQKVDILRNLSQSTQSNNSEYILDIALQKKRPLSKYQFSKQKKSSPTAPHPSKRPRKIFQTEGYDGSVQIPKPSSVLFRNNGFAPTRVATPVTPSITKMKTLAPEMAQDILEKQRNLAALMKRSKVEESGKPSCLSHKPLRKPPDHIQETAKSQKRSDDFASCFSLDDKPFESDDIISAKSRFASAANAEEYARARSVIQTLEAKEDEADKQKLRMEKNQDCGANVKNSKSKMSASIITIAWVCRTCKKQTKMKPVSCVRMRHDVKQKRELEGRVGSTRERLERHGKNSDEGGLTLGSGLEWSGWRGGFD
mmetsp:Transcript_24616/g.51276  ORF Transcript_24616/g.51276 Transcript_24616/m.51276 type:complete len:840 (+) Transcript_24616:214-2733(+)